MNCSISADLSFAFTQAVQTIEDPVLREKRAGLSRVTLLGHDTGFCRVGSEVDPKAGWRFISKEDMEILREGTCHAEYQGAIKRVAEYMANCPALQMCTIPFEDEIANGVELFWNIGHYNRELKDIGVLTVLSSNLHPELEEKGGVHFFISGLTPRKEEACSRAIHTFVHGMKIFSSLILRWDEVAESTELDTLSTKDFLFSLYCLNVEKTGHLKQIDSSREVVLRDLRRDLQADGLQIQVTAAYRNEIIRRYEEIRQVAEEVLLPLPHGSLIIETVKYICGERESMLTEVTTALGNL